MGGSILIVQTCNPNLLEYVVKDVKERHPDMKPTLFLQPQMKDYMSPETLQGCEVIVNPKSKRRRVIRELRKHGYKRVAFVLSGEPGYWKLKLLPFLLFPARPLAYDRHARPISLKPTGVARWLVESVFAPIRPLVSPRNISRKLASVPLSAWLLAFYLYQNLLHPYRRKSALKASLKK